MSSYDSEGPRTTAWVGWIACASMMMVIVGFFNVIDGLVAVFNDQIFVKGARGAAVLDVTTWGWIHVILGVAIAGAGLALMTGALWARMVGIALVMLNMLSQMVALPGYPFWAILVITVDALVLWALIVHGEEARGMNQQVGQSQERFVPPPPV